MSSELLASVAGVLLSLAFSYLPGLRPWFDKLQPDYKRLVMLAALALVAGGAFALACIGQYPALTCDEAGAWVLVRAFLAAAIANQAAYALTPRGG